MNIIKTIVLGIIGLLIGIGLSNLSTSGYFERWKILSPPTDYVYEYLIATDQQDFSPAKITKPCDYSSPEFSFLSNSPKNIVDCVQVTTPYAEGSSQETFVRDKDGNVWEWSYLSYMSIIKLVCWPSFGLLFGIGFAHYTNIIAEQIHAQETRKPIDF